MEYTMLSATLVLENLMAVSIPVLLFAILLVGIRRAGLQRPKAAAALLGAAFLVHLLLATMPALLGLYGAAPVRDTVYLGLVIALVILTAVLVVTRNRAAGAVFLMTPLSFLVASHAMRIIPGVIFLPLHDVGLVPGLTAFPAGIGDILVGLAAIPVALALAAGRERAAGWTRLWNWVGLADLVWALGSGMVMIPRRALRFLAAGESAAYLNYVYMLPAIAVALWIAMHVLLEWRLRREAEERRRSDDRFHAPGELSRK
jgi:hypothetical protein